MSVSDVIYGASWGAEYEVLTYDNESDEMRVKSSHTTLRESKRAARRLARSLGVPCRESGRPPAVWVPKLRCWVPLQAT